MRRQIDIVKAFLPSSVKGFAVQRCANMEWYIIFLNEALYESEQHEAFIHEIRHIKNGDFTNSISAAAAEIMLHNAE